tara:strand:- start:4 stop:165 length:162 start_codon:yes stop_codon:yes gene_type:complete
VSSENMTERQLANIIKELQEDYLLAFITKDDAIKQIMSFGFKKRQAKELFENT